MRSATIILAMLLCLSYPAHRVESSWLIDPERAHVSVHGRLSCLECHSDINEKKRHPDVADVDKPLSAFFRREQCAACHENVLNEINQKGIHHGSVIDEKGRYDLCIECHDAHYQEAYSGSAEKSDVDKLPDTALIPSECDGCMACHGAIHDEYPENVEKISLLCFYCHSGMQEKVHKKDLIWYPTIDSDAYKSTVHSEIACTECHKGSLEFKHSDQELVDCQVCHLPHNEKTAHDAHSDVTCGACHLNDITLVRDRKNNKVMWRNYPGPRSASRIHEMSLTDDDASCGRCHFKGNDLGAPASILPAKGIICMPCHAATFSIGDAPTAISLLIFIIGIINILFICLSGDRPERTEAVRLRKIIEALLLDVLLQRRLFRISRIRWLFHAVILYPVILRLSWGLVALLSSLWFNQWPWVRAMLDKNHPLTAFLFDVTGVMVIIGLTCIILRTKIIRSTNRIEGMPKRDWPAYGLLGAVIVVGFILEAMRISMTGSPKGSEYAFMGYCISRIINGAHLTDIYGTVWYIHAIFTAAFVSYLPFSRMLHVIIAPISLAVSACSKE
jgi:nitrate reductase gamma subunit